MVTFEPLEGRRLFADTGITLAPGYAVSQYAQDLGGVTAASFLPDGRLLVSEKGGNLFVVRPGGERAPEPAIRLTVNQLGERGLGSVAPDPDFANNGFIYVYYTASTPFVHNRVSRLTMSGDKVVAGSERVLLDLPRLVSPVHNGGAMHFLEDGTLLVAVGDANRPGSVQDVSSPFGKMLRLNTDGTPAAGNPFSAGGRATGWARYVWAKGLRNPYTFAVDPRSGLTLINDVGDKTWEEINVGEAGANYGWPRSEGPTVNAGETAPLFAYRHGTTAHHTDGSSHNHASAGGAITGGAFALDGRYFFADFEQMMLCTLDPSTKQVVEVASGVERPVDVDAGPDGAIYVTLLDGRVLRVTQDADTTGKPSITSQPRSKTTGAGVAVTFEVEAAGPESGGAVRYQWQKNGADLTGETGRTLTLTPALTDDGDRYRVVVSNDIGSVTSATALLSVDTNRAPVATIRTPRAGATFAGGDRISLGFLGTDPDEKLGNGALEYWVEFHHADHTHPFVPPTTGRRSATISIPRDNELATDVFYRVHLRVTDSRGLSTEVTRDITPRLTTMRVRTNLPAVSTTVTIDGQPRTLTAGQTIEIPSVVGMRRTIGYPREFVFEGTTYRLTRGPAGTRGADGTITAALLAPAKNRTYELVYRAVAS